MRTQKIDDNRKAHLLEKENTKLSKEVVELRQKAYRGKKGSKGSLFGRDAKKSTGDFFKKGTKDD